MAICELVCVSGAVPSYMLPSPIDVVRAFADDFPNLMHHAATTLQEAAWGLLAGIGLALIMGFVYMLWKKIITWHIPVSIIGTVFVFSAIMHLINPIYADPTTVILSGGLLLGAIFMATDYVTSPMTPKGQIIYGVSIGLLTIVIRNWGSYPEGMSFAILIMNAFTPLINNYVKPKRFGEEVGK